MELLMILKIKLNKFLSGNYRKKREKGYNMNTKHIIFDLDDTLIQCGSNYRACMDIFIDYQLPRFPHLSRSALEELCVKLEAHLRGRKGDIDPPILSTPGSLEFSALRFVSALESISMSLDKLHFMEVNSEAAKISKQIGLSLFQVQPRLTIDFPFIEWNKLYLLDQYPVIEGVLNMLSKQTGFYQDRLYLYTKGESQVQLNKLQNAELCPDIIPWNNVHIVSDKTPIRLRQLLYYHNIEDTSIITNNVIVVGDGYHDEISNALDVGIPPHHIVWITPQASIRGTPVDIHTGVYMVDTVSDIDFQKLIANSS